MAARKFDVVIERDEDGTYVASVPALPGCHTQADSLDVLMARIEEAAALCLEVEEADATPLTFVGHADGRPAVVPVHAGETIGPGLLGKILRDVGLSADELRRLL